MDKFHNLSIEKSLTALNSTKGGLSSIEAKNREKICKNEINLVKKTPIFVKFLQQFKDLMILILLLAAAISIFIGVWQHKVNEMIDGGIILLIVLMNAVIGLIQERKAEKSLDALKKMTEPESSILRDGNIVKLSSKNIVVGDVVTFDAGTIIPADIRLIESINLQIDESSLTGESQASAKNATIVLPQDVPLADRVNMAYKGSTVSAGRGLGVVTAVGKDTEIGKIAQSISTSKKEITPLQKNIKEVGKLLTYLVLAIAVVTFFLEVVARPGNPLEAFLTAVAISVAAIPESMPAVITIIMSMGIARLARQKAVVKSIHSVETLGCCDTICSDKTGTITQNKMVVSSIYCDMLFQNNKFRQTPSFEKLVSCMLLCNDSVCGSGKNFGDGTEIALVNFGKKMGLDKNELDKKCKRLDEIPFDSKRRMMSTLNDYDGQKMMFTKGAADVLLTRCKYILFDGKILPLTPDKVQKIWQANANFAEKALRVLGFACKLCQNDDFNEENLVFIGLVGMYDPPRKEIKQAVKKCKRAGMRAIMITGDHKDTAFAVAKECGIASDVSQVLTGLELDKMTDKELSEKLRQICVFARVSPDNKVRIVEALKKQGHIVAMTGDGVNDAPSLKKASIGIGMGITGTDVTKEVADMLVTDDNFATIVVAVEEGRKIYQNIVKAVKFLFSANMGELMSLFLATVFFPNFVFLYPVQILFVNLITDSLPAIALGLEPPENDLMKMKPRQAEKGIFSDGCGLSIFILGAIQTLLTVLAFVVGLATGGQAVGVTMAFYTLNIIQMFYLASMRTNGSMFKSNPFKNKMFIAAIGFSFGLLALIALTPLHSLLKLVSLPLSLWGVIIGLSVAMMLISEIYKMCYKRCKRGDKHIWNLKIFKKNAKIKQKN